MYRRVYALSAVVMWLACTSVLAQTASLKSRKDFTAGDHPVGVLVADIDGDGNLDLISVDELSSSLSLLKGFGDGNFRRLGGVTPGTFPTAAVLADVNGDGKQDLVSSNFGSQDVTVNLGDGLGGFGPKISSPVSGAAVWLAVGDWNGDGKIDAATVNTAQTMSVLFGDGAGHFTLNPAAPLALGANPTQIVAGDFNGDGNPNDLAVVCQDTNKVQLWINNGTGQFTLSSNSPATDAGPFYMAAADLNADNKTDIAVSCTASAGTVDIFLQGSNGSFGTPARYSPGFGPQGIAVSDINKDGKVDLLVALAATSGTGGLSEMLGLGGGLFGAPTVYNTGNAPTVVGVGDFDKNGSLDVVTANNAGNNVSILQNLGPGTFRVAGKINLPLGSFPDAVAVADFNNDSGVPPYCVHKPDVAIAYELTNLVAVASGDGQGNFAILNAANQVGSTSFATPIALAAADYNGDSNIDLVVANNGEDTFSVLRNSGTGNFTVTNGLTVGLACDSVVAVDSGEISGDAHPDVAFVCEGSGSLCTMQGTGLSGASTFGPPVCTQIGGTPEGIALGRYNQDALDDAAVTANSLNLVQIALSNGFGGVADIPATFPVNRQPVGVARGDLNGDGFLDLVVANSGSATISALLGDGGGSFSFPSIDSPAGQGPTAVALQDFNMDGNLDVAVVNTNANDVSLLLGDGAGHFSNAGNYGVRDQPVAIAAGDFNCDGKPDLAVADNLGEIMADTVTILLNTSVSIGVCSLGPTPGAVCQINIGVCSLGPTPGAVCHADIPNACGSGGSCVVCGGGSCVVDPLQIAIVLGGNHLVFQWGLVPGAVYDVIRGQVKSVTQGTSSFNLGAVTCLANDLPVTDTAATPDDSIPPPGDAYFYAVRAVVNGVPGQYTVSSPTVLSPSGKPGIPSSGSCP